jgi:hypothetical protein
MEMKFKKNISGGRKGILLTLLTIVLFVLMLGEVTTYVVINVNYDVLSQSAASASTQGATTTLVVISATGLLHQSLLSALATITKLENTPSLRGKLFINNTQYFFSSLMTNGTINGVNLTSYMGTAVMGNFNSIINTELQPQGVKLTILSSNITVFQGTPSTVNATYTALVLLNTTSGSFTYPVSASTSISLNGTLSIPELENANPGPISISATYPSAVLSENTYATKGSIGAFQFAFGTIAKNTVSDPVPACSNFPGANANYILDVKYANSIAQNACGFGGIIYEITNSVTTFNVPSLVYSTSSGIINIANGTQVLLDGKGLATYNISNIQSAIQNTNFFGSPYTPSYLDQASSSLTQRYNAGLFSFNLLNRLAPSFTDSGGGINSNIIIQKGNVILPSTFTISFWVNKNANLGGCDSIIGMPSSSDFYIYAQTVGGCTAGSTQGAILSANYMTVSGTEVGPFNSIAIPASTWVQAAVVLSPNVITWYINGNKVSSYNGLISPGTNANAFVIGSGSRSFNGSIAGVMVYNAALNPADIQNIYQQGLASFPTRTANLIAWYPLNGNGRDYSGDAFNGTSNVVTYKLLTGYYGDPIYKNVASLYNTTEVEGVLNCGNINQCTQSTVPHLYLGSYGLAIHSGTQMNESAALNLGNAILPNVMSFSKGGFIQEHNSIHWIANGIVPYSASIWVYPTNAFGTVIDEYNASSSFHIPFLSISAGTGYIDYNGVACQSIGTVPLNTWSDIAFTLSSTSFNGYLNGALRVSTTGFTVSPRSVPSTSNEVLDLGHTDTITCGSGGGAAYNGLMADFQVYNSALPANQVLALYLNDSITAVSANIVLPLSTAYGALNQTIETKTNNFGVFWNGAAACNVPTAVTGSCGLVYTPP